MLNDYQDKCRIVADDRENAGGVIDELRAYPHLALEIRRLKAGDFQVEGRFLVERKTMADLACSVVDARLFRQAAALASSSQRGVLVLEGNDQDDQPVSREALQGALITVGVFYGLAVLRAKDQAETARLLVFLAQQARKAAHGCLSRHGSRPKGRRARQLFILQGLPAVGPELAARLLDWFGSVEAVASASALDLAEINGIGDKIAKRIRWAFEPDARPIIRRPGMEGKSER